MNVQVLSIRPMGNRVKKYLRSVGDKVVTKNPDIMILAYYDKIIPQKTIDSVPYGIINFHPGYLPWNRGVHAYIWPLVDGSPAGVTIHYINSDVDKGDIIAQKKVPVYPDDIASDLMERTEYEIFELFKKVWPKIRNNTNNWIPQTGKGSYHYHKEITSFQRFDKETIWRLRACTFRDRSYGYYMDHGKKVYVGAKFFSQKDIDSYNKKHG